MKTTLHKASTRGVAEHDWLESHHTFSFADYYNPERIHFGTLRVLNDDIIAPSMGFDTHPHNNMEIISVPISGALRHKDSMGNEYVIKKNEVQTMSAGTGVLHSEYNASDLENANFLQIWVLPKKQNINPSYSQKYFPEEGHINRPQLIVSPDGREGSAQINQDAYFSKMVLTKDRQFTYSKYEKGNGVYLFVIDGDLRVNNIILNQRDGLGIEGEDKFEICADSDSEVLIMEVPNGDL